MENSKIQNFFKLNENGSTIKKEVLGGITTFLTMAYIIVVNPNILSSTGMDKGALITATCLTAALACVFMGLYANLPFALASGMGLNAYFAFTVCGEMGIPWQVALTAIFLEGIIFIVLSVTSLRETIANCIPKNLKLAVTGGIGLFIAFIGFVNAGIVVSNEATKVSAGNLGSLPVIITFISIIIITVCYKKGVRGSILIGIVTSAVLAWSMVFIAPELATKYNIALPGGIAGYQSIEPIAMKMDFSYFTDPQKLMTLLGVTLTFLFVDFFDTLGTLLGVASKVDMIDKEGRVKNGGKALLVDAVATTAGAMLGTSTVTTYVESAAGVADGARTGLASVVTGGLFFLAIFFSPIIMAVPSFATAPALIFVGLFMIQNVVKVDFTDFTEGVPAFLTIALMPLTYSIGEGLTIGILSYGVLNFFSNLFEKDKSKRKKVSPIIYGLTIIFILRYVLG